MHRPLITQNLNSARSISFKTINFQIDPLAAKKSSILRSSLQKDESSNRTKTCGISRNLQIVMRLSQIHTSPKQYLDSLAINSMTLSQNLSPNRKPQRISPNKRMQLKSALLNNEKKQRQNNINFKQIKDNNYKFFPKRQLKLKNNNPYKYYMFSHKSSQKNQFPHTISLKGEGKKQIKIQNICMFIPQSHYTKKPKSVQLRYRRENPYLEPWKSNKDQGKDDSIIF